MVGGEDDDRVVCQPQFVEQPEETPAMLVDLADHGVVATAHLAQHLVRVVGPRAARVDLRRERGQVQGGRVVAVEELLRRDPRAVR